MRNLKRKEILLISWLTLFVAGIPNLLYSQEDKVHFSQVFNRDKPYRIFLPADYLTSQKRYPVICYFHGNTGSHELDIPGVVELVKENGIILVAWNGRSEDTDLRPYNIGNHSNIKYQVQFKDYFPELVSYIDNTYRTLTDRANRAVIGHSMGGIMSFFMAGKYPHMIGTTVSSKGSPEFFIGYPDNHSLYHVRYMFKNLYGVRSLFTTGKECELFYLNKEVISGALRENGLDFSYKVYEGSHDISPEQFSEAFQFVVSSFQHPLPEPSRWNHADLYPDFDIWGYEVRSNKSTPGFIELQGVTKEGLGIVTKKWEPDGEFIPGVQINIKTPAMYKPNMVYSLLDFNISQDKKECSLGIRLLNKGGSEAKGIKVMLKSSIAGVEILNPLIEPDRLGSGDIIWMPADFKVLASNMPTTDGSPFRIRFNLVISDDKQHVWMDEFDVPVYYDRPEFTHIGIDDGDSEIFGSGNGNNIAEPGETVMIYEISSGSRRLRLYYGDPYIDDERLYDEIQPDKWGDGYSLSSLIHISKDCPPGHRIKFLANYEIKDWKAIRRDVTWGVFTIIIGDKSIR
jgi:enterochelin esterase-like enzyme